MKQETMTKHDALAYIMRFANNPNSPPTTVEDLMAENELLRSELTVMRSRERNDYFAGCTTVAEVKTRYLQLAYEHNFCSGGDEQTIQCINEQYDKACDPIILHNSKSEDHLVWQFERVELYKEVVAVLLILPSVKVEVINGYLSVTTTEYLVEKELRQYGFRLLPDVQAWCYPL
jgi:hypothetical protein